MCGICSVNPYWGANLSPLGWLCSSGNEGESLGAVPYEEGGEAGEEQNDLEPRCGHSVVRLSVPWAPSPI